MSTPTAISTASTPTGPCTSRPPRTEGRNQLILNMARDDVQSNTFWHAGPARRRGSACLKSNASPPPEQDRFRGRGCLARSRSMIGVDVITYFTQISFCAPPGHPRSQAR